MLIKYVLYGSDNINYLQIKSYRKIQFFAGNNNFKYIKNNLNRIKYTKFKTNVNEKNQIKKIRLIDDLIVHQNELTLLNIVQSYFENFVLSQYSSR